MVKTKASASSQAGSQSQKGGKKSKNAAPPRVDSDLNDSSTESEAEAPPKKRASKVVLDIGDSTTEDEAALPVAKKAKLKGKVKKQASVVDLTEMDYVPPVASSSKMPIDLDDDFELAKRLQEEEDAKADGSQGSGLIMLDGPSTASSSKSKGKGKARDLPSDTHDNNDPKIALEPFATLLQGSAKCGKCRGSAKVEAKEVNLDDKRFVQGVFAFAHARCTSCKVVLCSGCFQPASCGDSCKPDEKGCSTAACCANVRLVLLYHLLAALDRFHCADHLKKPVTPVKGAKPVKKKIKKGQGVGYGNAREVVAFYGPGMAAAAGAGWMGAAQQFFTGQGQSMSGKVVDQDSTDKRDEKEIRADAGLATALRMVSDLLPNPDKDEPSDFDFLPHTALKPLLLASTLTEILANLLRNDSIAEAVTRAEVYWASLNVLASLSHCEATLDVLTKQRPEKAWSDGIGSWIKGSGRIEWERVEAPRTTGSKKRKAFDPSEEPIAQAGALFDYLQKLLKQSKAFIKIEGAAAEKGNSDEATIQAITLADSLVSSGEAIERAVANLARATGGAAVAVSSKDLGSSSKAPAKSLKGKEKVEVHDADAQYAKECEELAFDTCDDGAVLVGHVYAKHKAVSWSAANSKMLNKEVVSWSTSLPPGIFVRVDENRRDLLKALIAGPADTPYAFGLYEFDIYLPASYPDVAPSVLVRTTAGGRWRSNPNLYAEGKVCLSLLGTWPGRPEEMWQPRTSTIQQVLISISAMILNDVPYQNEPGWSNVSKGDKRSKDYNREVALQNTRWAIIDWMSDKCQSSIWKDAIQMHCRVRAKEISKQLKDWAASDARLRAYSENTLKMQYGAYGRPMPAANASGPTMDLLNEFETRLSRVAKWT